MTISTLLCAYGCLRSGRTPVLTANRPYDRAGFKALGQFVTGAIGDIIVTIEMIVDNDGIVANRNRAHGTRKADGKEMKWIEHEFWRVENGQLAEQWSVADGLDVG